MIVWVWCCTKDSESIDIALYIYAKALPTASIPCFRFPRIKCRYRRYDNDWDYALSLLKRDKHIQDITRSAYSKSGVYWSIFKKSLTLRQLLPIVRRLKELPVAVLVLVGESLGGAEFEFDGNEPS